MCEYVGICIICWVGAVCYNGNRALLHHACLNDALRCDCVEWHVLSSAYSLVQINITLDELLTAVPELMALRIGQK